MKLFSAATLLAAVASSVNAIMVNTPASAVVCQPLLISWDPQGSAGPFFLSIVPGGSPTSPALFSWSNLTGTSFTWNVVEPAGTSLGLLLRDQTGATSQSAPFTVQANSNTSCLNSTSTSVPPSGSLPTTTTSTSTTTTTTSPTTTTTPKPTTTTTTPTPPTTTTTATPIPTATSGTSGKSSNGALSNAVNFGYGCLFAAFVGAFMV